MFHEAVSGPWCMDLEITWPQRSETMGLREQRQRNMTGAIIPALMHRIHQNSVVKRAWARVVLGWVTSWEVLVLHPSFWVLRGTIPACHLSSQWVRPSPSPSAPDDRQSGHPIARYGPSKSRLWNFSHFSAAWKIPSFRDDRRKRQAF